VTCECLKPRVYATYKREQQLKRYVRIRLDNWRVFEKSPTYETKIPDKSQLKTAAINFDLINFSMSFEKSRFKSNKDCREFYCLHLIDSQLIFLKCKIPIFTVNTIIGFSLSLYQPDRRQKIIFQSVRLHSSLLPKNHIQFSYQGSTAKVPIPPYLTLKKIL
jgi:hypothetical protein